jgi:CRP/FNR family transcriptional regulator, cyclic AMP receptor protein
MDQKENGAPAVFSRYCSPEWLPLIAHHQKNLHVAKNEYIFREGDPVEGIYIINAGKAKVISQFHGKGEHILRLAGDSLIVGHRALFSEIYSISAVALTPCEVSFIPISLFFQLYKSNTAFSMYMLEFFTNELRESEEQHYVLTIDNVRQRIAYSLVKLIRLFGYEKPGSRCLAYTLPRKDLATLGNTTYEKRDPDAVGI